MANNLPDGDVLIVLPAADRPQRRILETVALLLEGDGYHVTTVPAERFGSRH